MKIICLLLIITLLKAQNETQVTNSTLQSYRQTCLQLAKDYLYEHSEQLEEKAQNNKIELEEFIRRYIIYAVEHCESSYNTTQDIDNFKKQYEYNKDSHVQALSQHIETIEISMDSELSEDQKQIYKEYKQAEEAQAFYLFGYNLKKLPKRAKIYYLIVYTLIVVFSLYTGLKDVSDNSKPPKRE